MTQNLKHDIFAGFSVFLLALPLCLGIATASHFPPGAGILTAIVGGLIASLVGGAKLSIKGPAAGLIVIALASVTELGYECTLAVGVVAALLQIGFGLWKKAEIVEIIPPFVIHGMLAAIGVIIVLQQSYVLIGMTPTTADPLKLLLNFPVAVVHENPLVFAIGLFTLVIAFCWPLLKKVKNIPVSFFILAIVIPLSLLFNLSSEHAYYFMKDSYQIGPEFLVQLPENIAGVIHFPDFSQIFSLASLKYILMFSLVGSLESLLTVCAIDTLKPESKPSDLNRDLCAVGLGNLICSLIGGLPMISEIVRSKANVDYGATSQYSNFIHGLFMLLALLFLTNLVNLIPLSALAALLIVVGFRLASVEHIIHAYSIGKDQLAIFFTTFFVTLATNLLAGIAAGIVLKIMMQLLRGHKLSRLFSPSISVNKINNIIYITIEGPFTFLGYFKLKRTIKSVYDQCESIIIHLGAVNYLDFTTGKKLQSLSCEHHKIQVLQ